MTTWGRCPKILHNADMVQQVAAIRCSKHESHKQNEYTTPINWHYLADGEQFRTEGATLSALYMPGHTDDHVCFILEEENALFTGDHILGHGSTFVEHLDRYVESLERLQKLNLERRFRRFYPAHGQIVDGEAAVSDKIDEYLKHRLEANRPDPTAGLTKPRRATAFRSSKW